MNWKNLFRRWYLTDAQIISDLLSSQFSEEDKILLKNTEYNDLIKYHHSIGRWIRNHYRLWATNNPNVIRDDPNGPRFPDQISHKIIEECWKRLQQFGDVTLW